VKADVDLNVEVQVDGLEKISLKIAGIALKANVTPLAMHESTPRESSTAL